MTAACMTAARMAATRVAAAGVTAARMAAAAAFGVFLGLDVANFHVWFLFALFWFVTLVFHICFLLLIGLRRGAGLSPPQLFSIYRLWCPPTPPAPPACPPPAEPA